MRGQPDYFTTVETMRLAHLTAGVSIQREISRVAVACFLGGQGIFRPISASTVRARGAFSTEAAASIAVDFIDVVSSSSPEPFPIETALPLTVAGPEP